MSDWGSCLEYLKRAQVVPSGAPGCDVYNVVGLLKSGSVLCRLLNVIYPNSIDPKMISMNTRNSKYLCSKNIAVFLYACEELFLFKRDELFLVNDLLNEEDLDKVFRTLSCLSRTERSVKRLGQGFSNGASVLSKGEKYKATPPIIDECYANYDDHDEEEESIYFRAMDLPIQPTISGKKSLKEFYIEELVSTEKKYVDFLGNLLEKFKVPLSKVLNPSNTNFIFSSIQKMHEIHVDFYNVMLKTLDIDSRMIIAECFISNKEKFLLYGEYCYNVTKIQNFIDELFIRPEWKYLIEECEKSNGEMKFRDLFVVPMQRILKYPLFLKNCLDHVDAADTVEKKIFSKALEETEDLAQYVNEMKRDLENINNINRIQNNIKGMESKLPQGTHLKDYGRLQKDGEIKCKTSKRMCMLFLFDKILLLCHKTKDGDMLDLVNFFIISKYDLVSKHKDEKCFGLTFKERNTEFKAKTREDKDDWIKKIELAKDNTFPVVPWNKDTIPPKLDVHTFTEITICDVCRKLLKGLFFQGYHCPSPKINLHKECIPMLQYADISIIPDSPTSPDLPPPQAVINELWYAGNIGRNETEVILNGMPNGSFLLRKKGSGYAIGIRFNETFHILVDENQGQFGLGDLRYFSKIQDLVRFYSDNSLECLYSKLPTKLLHPFKAALSPKGFLCRVKCNFDPPPFAAHQLKLVKGSVVEIITTNSTLPGWWEGRLNNKVGYLHPRYVEQI